MLPSALSWRVTLSALFCLRSAPNVGLRVGGAVCPSILRAKRGRGDDGVADGANEEEEDKEEAEEDAGNDS